MPGYLPEKLAVELILKGRVLQTRVDEVLDGTEVMFECHRLHGSGEVELEMLKEVLGFCVEGAGWKRGESLVETSGCPV